MTPTPERIAARRADIDAKQVQIAAVLDDLDCEAAILLLPAHVAWFTSGLTMRGLIAENERPGVYTNGRQRWVICSNVDSQRLFDEELDQLGFQLKEWSWSQGRTDLMHNLCVGRKMASDRPITNMTLLNEKLRPLLRVASDFERQDLLELGKLVVHAVEATARNMTPGTTEEEAAGQIGHRLLHHGAEPVAIDVTADDRGRKYRRAGFTDTPVEKFCVLQATAQRSGLHVTVGRTICFGPPDEKVRTEYDLTARLAAAFRLLSRPGETVASAVAAETKLLAGTDYEFEARLSPPAYGCGRFPADELRRGGREEAFSVGQPLVWQARVGAVALVDTLLVDTPTPTLLTPIEQWPVRRVKLGERIQDVPDIKPIGG